MILTPVESTTLTGLAYDMANGLLYLEFRDQAIYRYSDVPAYVYRELLNATAVQNRDKNSDPCCKRGLCVAETGGFESGSISVS